MWSTQGKSSKPIRMNGIRFSSRKALCEYYDINYKTYKNLIGKGKTSQEIVDNPPKSKPRKPWSEEDKRLLKKYSSTKTAVELGSMLNRPSHSISRMRSTMKLTSIKRGENHPKSKLSNLQVAMILTLSDAGFKHTEIQREAFPQVVVDTINDIKFLKSHKD